MPANSFCEEKFYSFSIIENRRLFVVKSAGFYQWTHESNYSNDVWWHTPTYSIIIWQRSETYLQGFLFFRRIIIDKSENIGNKLMKTDAILALLYYFTKLGVYGNEVIRDMYCYSFSSIIRHILIYTSIFYLLQNRNGQRGCGQNLGL